MNVVPGEENILAILKIVSGHACSSQSQHVLKFARAKSQFKLIEVATFASCASILQGDQKCIGSGAPCSHVDPALPVKSDAPRLYTTLLTGCDGMKYSQYQ